MRLLRSLPKWPFPAAPRWMRLPVKKFHSDQSGVTAVEFAIIALPFFAILMAIIEAGLFFFASQVMDSGFREEARLVRTGQSNRKSEAQVRDEMCNLMKKNTGLFTCGSLNIDVRVLTNYNSAVSAPDPYASGAYVASSPNYTPTCGGDIVLMRAFYEWPTFANILGVSASKKKLNNGNILMSSSAVFINEPYGC